eukprot:8679531-Pyramimonas_sp.AAC.1
MSSNRLALESIPRECRLDCAGEARKIDRDVDMAMWDRKTSVSPFMSELPSDRLRYTPHKLEAIGRYP